jgi:septal ring factor EnvC (AmiA/AmiB activator)
MRRLLRTLLLLLACTALAAAQGQDRRRTEADLKAIAAQIEKVRSQVQRDAVERDRLSRDLRTAEASVAEARAELNRLRDQRGARTAERARLAGERSARQAALLRAREALAAQLRAAYVLGRDEPLKLLLNQKDPAKAGRTFAYYGYFGRMRATQIGEIQDNLRQIDELQNKLDEEDAELARLEEARRLQLQALEAARRARGKVLATLDTESRNRSESLQRLQRQQGQLDKLLKDLNRALENFPVDANDAFAKLRGQLAWPVAGRISARYGETRAGGVKWNGVVIATERGAPVKAIYGGRVAYADWLPGLGLLLIIDHGNGYLSLYGYNEQLYKAAGSTVQAGDTIAGAGDSGGRSQNELYFEIRRAGKPVDPRPWFRSGAPPPN